MRLSIPVYRHAYPLSYRQEYPLLYRVCRVESDYHSAIKLKNLSISKKHLKIQVNSWCKCEMKAQIR